VLIKRRDVRLRERRIGPYKYPTIDSPRGGERKDLKTEQRPSKKKPE